MKIIQTCVGLFLCIKGFSQASLLVGSGSYLTGGNNAYITLQGDLRADGTVNTSSTSTWNFSGSVQQRITCTAGTGCTAIYSSTSYPVTVGNVVQNNANGISVEVNTIVNGTHTFTSGTTQIGDGIYWLTKTSGAYSGNNATGKFFVTTGYGLLKQSSITTGRLFPVGSSASANDYTPATIVYSGTADNFSVRVMDNVYYSYNSANGAPLTTTTNTRFVKKTWIIKKDTRTTGDSFTPTLQWNAINEDAAFTARRPTDVTIARNHDGFWFPNSQGPASGSNPYTLSGTVTYDNAGYEYYPVSATAINTILAVTGLKFTGSMNAGNVVLQWSTLSETDMSYFELQRSTAGTNFTTITRINATGNLAGHQYNYDDVNYPATDKLYYRLKMVDKDNTAHFTDVVLIKLTGQQPVFTIYPNPATNYINVYAKRLNGEYAVQLCDLSGKIIQSSKITLQNAGLFRVPCKGIPAGIYILNITDKVTSKQFAYKVSITP